jgi:hypothetical protein
MRFVEIISILSILEDNIGNYNKKGLVLMPPI